jgi:lysophospholipase L1-like esterase
MAVRFLALGDSYTIGESVTERERWPNQLAALLNARGYQTEVTIIARTGWTTGELREGLQKTSLLPPYNLVSILIGVNNQYRGYDLNTYREEFRFLLGKAVEYAGGHSDRVLVLSIPDWGMTPFAAGRDPTRIASEVAAFNAVNRAEAEHAGVHYVDVVSVSRLALDDPALIAGDGLHPSGKMYTLWAELALPEVTKVMKEEGRRLYE